MSAGGAYRTVVLAVALGAAAAPCFAQQPDSCHGYALVLPYAVEEPPCVDEVCELLDAVVFHSWNQSCPRRSQEKLAAPGSAEPRPRIDLGVSIEYLGKVAPPRRDRAAITRFLLEREFRNFPADEHTISAASRLRSSHLPFLCKSAERAPHGDRRGTHHVACVALDGDRAIVVHAEFATAGRLEREAVLASLTRMRRL